MTFTISAEDLASIRNAMTAKPLATDDLAKVRAAINRLHGSLLHVEDPTKPWSFENRAKSHALVVIGPFRAGKTYCVNTAISRLATLTAMGTEIVPKPVRIKAPASLSVESLGRELLDAMRLVPSRALGPSLTVERLHKRLRIVKPTLIHIDEAQRLLTPERVAAHRVPDEQLKIFSHLRALMDLDGAPSSVVLSGTREMIPVLERHDLGFFRDRMDIVFLEPMKVGRDEDRNCLEDALKSFGEAVDIRVGELPEKFFDRLILAANYARGLAFEICQEAILGAVVAGRQVVELDDFEAFYARKAGCYRDANPFVAPDWHRIDPTALLAAMAGEKAPKIGDVRK